MKNKTKPNHTQHYHVPFKLRLIVFCCGVPLVFLDAFLVLKALDFSGIEAWIMELGISILSSILMSIAI